MSIVYIGMDVHKNSYSLCAINGENNKVVAEAKIEPEVKLILKFIEKIKDELGEDIDIITGYEAGNLGYSLYRELLINDVVCVIMAPSTINKSVKAKANKNDRKDAYNLANNLRSGTYKAVYVPSEEDTKVKEYIRMLQDFKDEAKRVKQHINALILRLGIRCPLKTKWTIAYYKWLDNLELDEEYREIIDEYLIELRSLLDKIERYEAKVVEIAKKDEYREDINKMRCFKGIDTLSAMKIKSEISDFERFPNAKAFASYVGLAPMEDSSGEKVYFGAITKQGNNLVRKTLVECAQAIVRGQIRFKSKRLKARQAGQDPKIIEYADKCSERLQKKFNRLIKRGIHRNKAICAVARELACFIWGMETGHID